MWCVKITKAIPPIDNPFRDNFFPRVVRLKADAENLAEEVRQQGGEAKVVKMPNITAKQVGGDDGYQWTVFVNGKEFVNGLTLSEVPYYKKEAERKFLKTP